MSRPIAGVIASYINSGGTGNRYKNIRVKPSKIKISFFVQRLHKVTVHIIQRALIAFGLCGNSLAGLQSRDMTLIVPRVDDCISLLLGSQKNRAAMVKGNGTYFLTEGWLKGERSIGKEYAYIMGKYGEETGRDIFEKMFGNYRILALLDTGCFDLPRAEAEAVDIAKALRLEYKVVPATIDYLIRLLTGPWDSESFLIVEPGSAIRETDFIR